MKYFTLLFISLTLATCTFAQQKISENIVIITMDGLRWQEVFSGADSLLTFDNKSIYSADYVKRHFWDNEPTERRKKLMPFLWGEIAKNGAIMGNREHGNYFNNANPYWFSYPGYNEIFTGYPDTAVNSNAKTPNKNVSVLEWLNDKPAFKNKVAVFGSWDVFASIFNEARSGLMINDGFRNLQGKLTKEQKMYNRLQHEMPDLFHGGERLDVATFHIAFEYLKINKPRVLFIGLGDTDEFAHAGMYDYYMDAARKSDDFIRYIWEYLQSDEQYKDKTTLIISTDHGRGEAKGQNWKHHGRKTEGSSEMWMAAIGASVKPSGEVKTKSQAWQAQIATTIAKILGESFQPDHPVYPALLLNGE